MLSKMSEEYRSHGIGVAIYLGKGPVSGVMRTTTLRSRPWYGYHVASNITAARLAQSDRASDSYELGDLKAASSTLAVG